MDAGVFQLHVFPHQALAADSVELPQGEPIVPELTADSPVEKHGRVSLVIPTFFNRELKRRSLRLLLQGVTRSQSVAEIVLVAADDQFDELEELQEIAGDRPCRLAGCEPNQRGRTRNIGAHAASHDHILFLDDDMLVRDWRLIDAILSRMLCDNFDCALFPRRHYVRFPLLYEPARLQEVIAAWREQVELESTALYDPWRHGHTYKMVTFCFPGCFTLVSRQAFQRIGGFPEEFEGWGFEDTAFAMRATAQLRVLNLFRKSEPLLHIDHPVSPYKSEEYGKNGRRFFSAYTTMDVDWLCDRVMAGDDFFESANIAAHAKSFEQPLQQISNTFHIPWVLDEVREFYRELVDWRTTAAQTALPEFITLHGSRGRGEANPDSDFDVLFLFRGGRLREFFVCQQEKRPPVEIEFADLAKFEEIALRPAFYPSHGPLELAKLAQSQLLSGCGSTWRDWVTTVMRHALDHGRELWLLFALGTSLQNPQLAAVRQQFTDALRLMMVRADAAAHQETIDCLETFDPRHVGLHVQRLLDEGLASWRDDLRQARRLFAFQVPEVWSAMRWIASLK